MFRIVAATMVKGERLDETRNSGFGVGYHELKINPRDSVTLVPGNC